MIDLEHLPSIFQQWRARHLDRDTRYSIMDAVVRGDFEEVDPDEQEVTSRSPNLIQVAIEDVAESAALVPTIRAQPLKEGPRAKKTAGLMEQIGASWFEANEIDFMIPRLVMDAQTYGMMVVGIHPDEEQGTLLWERRDPRTCYPEPGWRPGDTVQRVFFSREIYFSQLPLEYQVKMIEHWDDQMGETMNELRGPHNENLKVVLVDWYDQDHWALVAMWQTSRGLLQSPREGYIPVLLEEAPHVVPGLCPVVMETRLTIDNNIRGQYDQVVDMLLGHIRLMALAFDYSDQSVYSDIWVRDLIGEMPYGGGAFIELGPQGAIGRVPPAVSSMNVMQDLQVLTDGIHTGGRWPRSRPGEIDQSIASAKFLEASAGMMNTAIRTYHLLLKRMFRKLLNVSFKIDKALPGSRRAVGVLRNQMFVEQYEPDDIDTENVKVRVEYGLGMGKTPSESAVIHIQYNEMGAISKAFVQENIDLDDVGREQARIAAEEVEAMAKAKLLEMLQGGMLPPRALVEIHRMLQTGTGFVDAYMEWVVKPAEEQEAAQVDTGMGMAMPGLPPPMPGPAGPGGPPVAGPPVPPGGADLLARMNINGDGRPNATLGTQVERSSR